MVDTAWWTADDRRSVDDMEPGLREQMPLGNQCIWSCSYLVAVAMVQVDGYRQRLGWKPYGVRDG